MQSIEEAVVDANVIIHSRGQMNVESVYVPGCVLEEVKSYLSGMKLEKYSIERVQPSENSLNKVVEKSEEINSPTSKQDERALALAMDKVIPILTDDKALQNLALHLGVEFLSFNSDEVSERWEWTLVCQNCGSEEFNPPCSRCGCGSLSRRRDRKS